MAILRFNIPSNLDSRSVARNALRGAENYLTGAGVNYLKGKAYEYALASNIPTLSSEEQLMFEDTELPRNTIRFKFPNPTTTNPNAVYELILIGAEISAMRNNTIVSTPLVGRRGTVKEFISSQDYKITISGELIRSEKYPQYTRDDAYSLAYPIEMLQDFVRLIDSQETVEIANVFLKTLGVTNVVIENHRFKQTQKLLNVQPFSFSFISDQNIDLYNITDNA